MRTFFFLSVILVFFILGCSEKKKRKFVCKEEYLQNCVIIKIKKIKTTIQIDLDREKFAEAGISTSTLQYKLRLADKNQKLKTVKAAEQLVIAGRNGKKHRLSEFAKIRLGIIVSYEYPWSAESFSYL